MESYVRLKRTDIWREGKWLDLWSVVHFLSGISIALGVSILNFGFWPTSLIVLLMLIAYELWEAVVQIEETPQNRFMDVVVGMASFLLAFVYIAPFLSGEVFWVVFAIVLIINITLATLGWQASQKAIVLEQKLHAEYLQQRTLLSERRKLRRERRLRRKVARRERKALKDII